MICFECKQCNYYTNRKANYERHVLSQKHKKTLKYSQNIAFTSKNIALFSQKTSKFMCKYCYKEYTHQSSLSKHIKYSCTKNKDEDLKELVRLMNLQLEKQRGQMLQKDKELQYHKEQNENQQKQIDKLMDKLQVPNITNIQNNIQLLSYKDTDVSHLTEKDYIGAIKQVTFCVKSMIEKIHFNPLKPENRNIYISNMKDKYIMVYEGNNWNLKNKSYELNNLYDTHEMLLEDWLESYGTKELRDKYDRYLNNKEDEETMNMIKDEIKLMMYNKGK